MTKQEFLERLNSLLSNVPKAERDGAMQYYEEYFAEAGIKEDGMIPEDMDTPEKIAKDIWAGLGIEEQSEESFYQKEQNAIKEKQPMDSSKMILIAIVAVFTLPLWGSILISIAGVLLGLVGALFGILVAIVSITFAFLVSGVAIIAAGVIKFTIAPIVGMTAIGVGLVLFGIGLLFLMFVKMVHMKFSKN